MIRFLVVIAFSFLFLIDAAGQTKARFRMPSGVEYHPGKVLAKVKPGFKEEITRLATGKAGARLKTISGLSVSPLVKPELARQGAALRAPRIYQPKVDIARFFTISFPDGRNVENLINDLYATGYFEIVEPDYAAHASFTPNDPQYLSQYYLKSIRAPQAWDITKGDTTITIAIVDSGGALNHPDLNANLYTNWAEFPPNGIDDDGNGFIDDYRGWDFIGADTLNLGNPSFAGDNSPLNTHDGGLGHGTMVGGCASGVTNNNTGIAGVGYKTRLMFTKHTADNQKSSNTGIYSGYDGVLYAANLGIKIINCSWGGTGKSAIYQEIIDHVVLDLGSLVVAAAGNSGTEVSIYPGAYEHVLSVAATDASDKAAGFTTFGGSVDLSAPGVAIVTTQASGYITVDGTSFSSPITCGAAALVWAKNPGYGPLQVAEQLRVSADENPLYSVSPANYANKMGRGRLNIEQALIMNSPSLRAFNPVLTKGTGSTVLLDFDFTNFLASTSGGLQISIISQAPAVATVTKSSINPGIINSNSTYSNKLNPFILTISETAQENAAIPILITFSDGTYVDHQLVKLFVNRSYIDINSNRVATSVTNIGRVGYQDPNNAALGQGFVFDTQSLLFEMGLLMGTSPTSIENNIRGINGGFDQDFKSITKITQVTPGLRSTSEVSGEFSNSATPAQQNIIIDYQSLVWKDAPYDKFVILEYKIKNPTTSALNNFYFGIFADWDISPQNDAANWNDTEKMGYVYPVNDPTKPYAGIQVLRGTAGYYALDNDQKIAGNPFGLYDGFTDAEKFTSLTTQRLTAGLASGAGNDVSHVVSSGPYNIDPGATITIAFAVHAAPNLNDLLSSAQWADSIYNYTLNASRPLADSVAVCYGAPATLNASGSSVLKWYKDFTGGVSFSTGNQVITSNLFGDTTLYVSNAENSFESVRTPVVATARANPKISTSGSSTFCQGNSIILSIAPSDEILWSTGATANSITVSTAGSYSVITADTLLDCHSSSIPVTVSVNQNPVANFAVNGSLNASIPISFADLSTDAISWSWDFGDGGSSSLENPQHTYINGADFTVTLTVTNTNGCLDTKASPISVVTAVDEAAVEVYDVYPNPVSSSILQVSISGGGSEDVEVTLINSMGESMHHQRLQKADGEKVITIPVFSLASGLYILKLQQGERIVTRKVIRVQ